MSSLICPVGTVSECETNPAFPQWNVRENPLIGRNDASNAYSLDIKSRILAEARNLTDRVGAGGLSDPRLGCLIAVAVKGFVPENEIGDGTLTPILAVALILIVGDFATY